MTTPDAQTWPQSQAEAPTVPPLSPLAVRPAEAARMLGLSPRKLWELSNRGEIPAAKVGRAVLYRVGDLDAWLVAQTAKGVRR